MALKQDTRRLAGLATPNLAAALRTAVALSLATEVFYDVKNIGLVPGTKTKRADGNVFTITKGEEPKLSIVVFINIRTRDTIDEHGLQDNLRLLAGNSISIHMEGLTQKVYRISLIEFYDPKDPSTADKIELAIDTINRVAARVFDSKERGNFTDAGEVAPRIELVSHID
ncbi:MAG: hypothetical protein Q7S22_07200 [Candidatus Micrarchaeota archaeon]|nr:hypothetical protein [Candidatus Micrarchaeota archaeon]